MITLAAFETDMEMIARIILALFLGGAIGWEREKHGIPAGIRTYGAIALGSCVFGILSLSTGGITADPSRIAAQIVTGIGFLGGGVILRHGESVTGLTTAATLWATAAVGLAISFGFYIMGSLTALLIFLLLYLARFAWWKKLSGNPNVKHNA